MAHPVLSIIYYLLITTCGSLANEVVLLTGGWPKPKSVEVYDKPGCSISHSLPDKRAAHSSHYLGGKILLCGGWYTKRNCLQLGDRDFAVASHLAEDRWCHSGLVISDRLSLIGGHGSPRSMELRLAATRWSRGWPVNHWVDGSCVVALAHNKVIVMGGMGGGDKVSMYDGHKTWTRRKNLPTKRVGHSCVLLEDGAIMVAGGWEGAFSKILDTVLVYKDDEFRELPRRMMTPRAWGQMVRVDDRILYFGGRNNQGENLDTVEEFDEATQKWKKLGTTMKSPRSYFSAVVVPASKVGCRS